MPAALLWLVLALADPTEVSIRSGAYSPPAPTISARSNLVQSGVTLYDAHARAVGGFTSADFTVSDNGKPQTITVFSEVHGSTASRTGGNSATGETDAVRYVALFFDDLHLSAYGLPLYRKAAEKLISHIPAGERVGIFTDSGTVTVDFTSDQAALLAALARIRSHRDPAVRGMTVCPALTDYSAFVILERVDEGEKEAATREVMNCMKLDRLDAEGIVTDTAVAVWENSRHYTTNALDLLKVVLGHLAKQEGERLLVMVSGGFPEDGRMKAQIASVLDDAVRGHVVVNSLAVESQMGYRQLILTNTMVDAASATGGRVIKNTNDLDGALGQLAAAPEVPYLLGFQAGEPDGKYHPLKVGLRNSAGLKVETRPGYFATLPTGNKGSVQERIDKAVRSQKSFSEMPAAVRVVTGAQKDGRYKVQIMVDVDAKHIRFAAQSGLDLQQLTFVTAIEDAQGNFVAGKQAVMDLRVKPQTLSSMQATGIRAAESFLLGKGDYTVRTVVRELVQDHIAASSTPVRLR